MTCFLSVKGCPICLLETVYKHCLFIAAWHSSHRWLFVTFVIFHVIIRFYQNKEVVRFAYLGEKSWCTVKCGYVGISLVQSFSFTCGLFHYLGKSMLCSYMIVRKSVEIAYHEESWWGVFWGYIIQTFIEMCFQICTICLRWVVYAYYHVISSSSQCAPPRVFRANNIKKLFSQNRTWWRHNVHIGTGCAMARAEPWFESSYSSRWAMAHPESPDQIHPIVRFGENSCFFFNFYSLEILAVVRVVLNYFSWSCP